MFLLKGNNNLIIDTVWSLHRSYPVWDANRSQTVFASAFRYGEYLRYVSTPTAECASLYSADSHVCRLRSSRVTCVRGSVVVCRATGETRHSPNSFLFSLRAQLIAILIFLLSRDPNRPRFLHKAASFVLISWMFHSLFPSPLSRIQMSLIYSLRYRSLWNSCEMAFH